VSTSERGIELSVEEVSRRYGRSIVLDSVSLTVPAGSTYALLGSSGAGKSTLLKILALLEKPSAGHVTIDGREVSTRDRAARLRMAVVFQKPYLFTGTVGYNVGWGLTSRGVRGADAARRVAAVLERVGLGGWQDRRADSLSGGEAQRVAIARALVLEPEALLLDEPFASLDPVVRGSIIRDLTRILAEERVTCLYVTHDQDEAMVVADRIGILHEGRFVREGEASEVMTVPTDLWVAKFIGMEQPIRGRVTASSQDLAVIECEGLTLYAASDLAVGTSVLVGVRPEDITLFPGDADIPLSSARNRLAGVIRDVHPTGVSVRVTFESGGVAFAASVSRASASALGLAPGARVTATFKATAVRVGVE
jgi:tungstate transport system ATP-binding protein